MVNIDKVLKLTQRYGARKDILANIFNLAEKIGKNKISNLSKKLLRVVTTTEEKLFVATLVVYDLYYNKIYHQKRIEEMSALIQEIELENRDFVSHSDDMKFNIAMPYALIGIMTNNISLFEKSISLFDQIQDRKKNNQQLAYFKTITTFFNNKIGRKPAALSWKIKKKSHIFLQKNFAYDLIDMDFPKQ